jgi:hypothetical protein
LPRDVCGRTRFWADTCLVPDPTLTENELLEVFRDDTEGVRDEVEEENEVFRERPGRVVPFNVELMGFDAGGHIDVNFDVSPARSARVFLFGGGSGTITVRKNAVFQYQ